MSAPKLYFPMFTGLSLGDEMSSHDGVRCYPAIRHSNDEKFIVKVISVPASQIQLDALLLTGAFTSREMALEYYHDIAQDLIREADILQRLSQQEGFVPYLDSEISANDDFSGYEIYLLGSFKHSLEQIFQEDVMTHKSIVDMALDLCAALAACRRNGYIYVDLRPGNIFYSQDQGYRIGDLGFVALSSLTYTSLPEKYRSRYSAPELLDEMAVLNDTADVYALGLILYQAYNGGVLPESAPGQPLPAPLYADYEFAEIILKACHIDPAKRWEGPTALALAIIAYVQKNAIAEGSIIPCATNVPQEEAAIPEAFLPEISADELQQEMDALAGTEYEEFAFLANLQDEEADKSETLTADLTQVEISQEITQMLAQADELIAHELPEPAVAPPPIEVPVPAAISDPVKDEDPIAESLDIMDTEPELLLCEEPEAQRIIEEDEEEQPESTPPAVRRPFPWKIIVCLTVIAAVFSTAFAGFYFYHNHYLQHIDDLIMTQNGDVLSVKVVSSVDQSLLTVICSDRYGNTQRQPVAAGVAIFTDLDPQTLYHIRLEISGFHKLAGKISGSFSTPAQTQITNLIAEIGNEDGSVQIHFSTAGPDVDLWTLTYSAPNEEPRMIHFQGRSVHISQLQIGLEYTFTLSRQDGQPLAGQTQIQYTASQILLPKNLQIVSCGNGSLTLRWDTPDTDQDIIWTVRCYNSSGYNESITTNDTLVTFNGMQHNVPCTVDVTAEGMRESGSITVTANPVSVEQFHFTTTEDHLLQVSWDHWGVASQGWILEYSMDGMTQPALTLTKNTAQLLWIPGGIYKIQVTAVDASSQYGGSCNYQCPQAPPLDQWGLTADSISGNLCIRPETENWSISEVTEDMYTASFLPCQAIGLILTASTETEFTEAPATIQFDVRNSEGTLLSTVQSEMTFAQQWTADGCCVDIPWTTDIPGEYTVSIYCDGYYMGQWSFSIQDAE